MLARPGDDEERMLPAVRVASARSSVREGQAIQIRLSIDPAPSGQVRSVVFIWDSERGSQATTTVSHTTSDTDDTTTDR